MRFTDFLKTTVLLCAGEATALAAVTIVAAAGKNDEVTIWFGFAWWTLAALIGAWIGRRKRLTMRLSALLSGARSSGALPEIRPGEVLVNRLWPLGVSALFAAGISWLFPQFAAVAAGFALLAALAWRKQEAAVTAIEGRDGAQFYVVPSSPFGGIELVRTPGYRYPTGNGVAPLPRPEDQM
jgi:hypothetical protein